MLNQLVQTVTPDNVTVVNTYNGEGLRVAKTVDNITTNYLYEYDKVVLETDGDNNQKARNVYGTNLICRTVDGQTLYYLYNGHADVVALVDSTTGNTLATYYYDAFGNIVEQTGNVDNNITYAGYQYDKETNTYYLMSRMYDPVTARFLQEETYSGDKNDPLSLNLYTYCQNEPIKYDDPSGHAAHILVGAVIGAVIDVGATAISDYLDDGKFNKVWREYAGAATEGAVIGAVGAATGGASLLATMAAEGVAGATGNAARQYISKGKVNGKQALTTGALSAAGAGVVKLSAKGAQALLRTKLVF